MTRILTATFSLLLLSPYIVGAQSTSFEPVEGYLSSYQFSHEYHTKVRDILLKGITGTPDAMLVTLTSFSPERAVVLSKGEVISLKCSVPIWNNDAPDKIKVEKTSVRISKKLSVAVHKLWFDALGTTSYPNESRAGLDGASYYFTSFKTGLGLRAGTVWSPEAKSLPSELLRIAYELPNLEDGGSTSEKALLTRVNALHAKTTKKEQAGTDQPSTASDEKKPKLESKEPLQ